MNPAEFTRVLAHYLVEGWMTSDDHEAMDESQKWCIHRIDLARAYLKRLEIKEKI
jgi:hypothetical protein